MPKKADAKPEVPNDDFIYRVAFQTEYGWEVAYMDPSEGNPQHKLVVFAPKNQRQGEYLGDSFREALDKLGADHPRLKAIIRGVVPWIED